MWTWFTSQPPEKQALAIIEVAFVLVLVVAGVWYQLDRRWAERLDEAATAALVASDDPDGGWWNAPAVPPPAPATREAEWVPRPARLLAHTRQMTVVPVTARPAPPPRPGWSQTQLMPAVIPAGRASPRHEGATADWSPTGELQQLVAGQFTPTEVLPSRVVQAEVRVPDADALRADVHDAFEGWDKLFVDGFARIDRVIAAARSGRPGAFDPSWAVGERTQALPIIRTRELVSA